MSAVDAYINDCLIPTLQSYRVSFEHTMFTAEVVRKQMKSLMKHWNDRSFRNTVLLFGTEEGTFYQLSASKIDVRRFVVVTLRNSPVETIQSNACNRAGLAKPISDDMLKKLTYEAIMYFNPLNFEVLCRELQDETVDDIYYDVLSAHPVSWNALSRLAAMSSKMMEYKPADVRGEYVLPEVMTTVSHESSEQLVVSVADAYESDIDPQLCIVLKQFENMHGCCFITPSFKGLSRNFEKVVRIMEYLLSRENSFVTANYYVQNGHLEQRMKVLKAAHSTKEIKVQLQNVSGLGYRHKSSLKQYAMQQQ